MISFCMGHTSTSVNDFWTEPIILWIAIVLPTGKGSAVSLKKKILNTTANNLNLWLADNEVLKTLNDQQSYIRGKVHKFETFQLM